MGTTPISVLAPYVLNRLEEDTETPVFWSLEYEINTLLIEAISDLLLLVGRPTQIVNVPFTLQPNTPWQVIPDSLFCVTDVQGSSSQVWKVSLFDMDFLQSSWSSGWQNDVGTNVNQWFALGFGMFGIHPSVSVPTTVTLTGIAPATTDAFPYDGSQTVPFHSEFYQALEKYAAGMARMKEGGNEFELGVRLYKDYLQDAQRLTQIEDRRDPYIFTESVGANASVKRTTQR